MVTFFRFLPFDTFSSFGNFTNISMTTALFMIIWSTSTLTSISAKNEPSVRNMAEELLGQQGNEKQLFSFDLIIK